ncbi:MAG TPA: MBL fold metallo-hydrolase [Candidatus Acidoferrum sp.]|jgi:metallo-beta-lactamase family protein|nr:MBL fold metallo-hydrolase [Candidatus Acidoferrum sp.]
MAKLTFLGAAGSVTGSKYLVEAAGKKLLVDCGLFQGTQELKDRNWKPLPVEPATIDYAVLTHAHLDHTGWLPVLVRDGYRGPIFANPATIELTEILLKDSAHLQEEETEHAKKKKYSRHAEPRSLYTPDDVEPVLKQLKTMPRSGNFDISPEFHVASFDAGHILGSSSLELTIREASKTIVVVFSGDIGRYGEPILKEPTTPASNADVLICESTYGDREHQDGNPEELLAQIVNRVVKRGGSIVIPAFAIGRTQTFMYYLRRLEDQQRIPRIPVYVDSPMALSATELYIKHKEDHDLEFAREEGSDGKGDPLNVHEFHLTRSAEESKAINKVKTPCIIISASGMVSGGRVLHHMVQRLPDAKNAVILAGFQAEGTRGRALQEGAKTLNIFGQAVPVGAEIVEMGQFSAHAGKSELLRWLSGFPSPPKQTYLTHGEPAAAQALAGAIQQKFEWKAAVARYLDTVPLGA